MEQHPVPQNVTTFQFRLIGDMTIKQFGYLAGGIILAYISYRLPLPFFFTWPLVIVFGLGGFGFAFVPVEERPMDIWVLSFLKSIYSPTQYIWQKEASEPPVTPVSTDGVANGDTTPSQSPRTASDVLLGLFAIHPAGRPQRSSPAAQPEVPVPQVSQHIISAQPKTNPWSWFTQMFSFSPPVPKQASGTGITPAFTTPSVTGRHIDLSPPPSVAAPTRTAANQTIAQVQQREEALEQKLTVLKKDLENKTMTETRVLELQKQLTEVLAQKEKMGEELDILRRQASVPRVVSPPSSVPRAQSTSFSHIAMPQTQKSTNPTVSGQTVKIITPESAVKVGLPRLTTFPNVVTGIIKDGENNLLPGVLVTVKDKDGVPLRALKTNRLGQFAASTPLANGVYFVEIEDPRGRFTFDRVQITFNGSIVPAIEIIAKSQRQMNREMLEKELFGAKP